MYKLKNPEKKIYGFYALPDYYADETLERPIGMSLIDRLVDLQKTEAYAEGLYFSEKSVREAIKECYVELTGEQVLEKAATDEGFIWDLKYVEEEKVVVEAPKVRDALQEEIHKIVTEKEGDLGLSLLERVIKIQSYTKNWDGDLCYVKLDRAYKAKLEVAVAKYLKENA